MSEAAVAGPDPVDGQLAKRADRLAADPDFRAWLETGRHASEGEMGSPKTEADVLRMIEAHRPS
ncbi:MAG TPA: hypothetical protein VJ653_05785 [Acidimicrobiales bacterium]|nr:hypothetical protein [Acidimicrobiales bacterium]